MGFVRGKAPVWTAWPLDMAGFGSPQVRLIVGAVFSRERGAGTIPAASHVRISLIEEPV